jgi:hypothetical protein
MTRSRAGRLRHVTSQIVLGRIARRLGGPKAGAMFSVDSLLDGLPMVCYGPA